MSGVVETMEQSHNQTASEISVQAIAPTISEHVQPSESHPHPEPTPSPDQFQKSSDPLFWGPGMWKFLHAMAANYPESPAPQFKASCRQFFFSLRHLLPCEKCRGHFNALLAKRPPDTDSSERLQEWVMWMHNEVNMRIKPHLPPWTIQQIKETYKSDSYVPTVNQPLPPNPQQQQHQFKEDVQIIPKENLLGLKSLQRTKQTLRDRINFTLRKRVSPNNNRRPVNFFQVSKVAQRSRKSVLMTPRHRQQHLKHNQSTPKTTKQSSGNPSAETAEEKDCGCKK
jgi:hypothetical protein